MHVIPRARRTEPGGVRDGAFVIRLAAPPIDGAANEGLVKWLASTLGVPNRAVRILSGERRRRKRIAIHGVTLAQIEATLLR